jgi:uncharacterized protein YlxP (DUF503 family)
MLVGVCRVELFIPDSGSLKSKRFVLNSIKTKVRNKFNVSVSEVGDNEKWQRVTLGMSLVSNDRRFIDQTFHKVIQLIAADGRAEVVDHVIDLY